MLEPGQKRSPVDENKQVEKEIPR